MIKTVFIKYINNFRGFSTEIKVLALATFINRAGAMVVPFLSKYMLEELHFTYSQIGWVMVFFGIGSFLGTWISGKLVDSVGFYKIMMFSLFGTGALFIVLQFLTTFTSFCIGVLILTTISDLYRPAMLVSIDTYSKREERTRALSLVRSSVNLGFMFGPLIGGIIINVFGYSNLFYIDGLTCISSIFLFTYFVKEKKSPFKLKKFEHLKEEESILSDKPFLMHLVITLITGILFFQIFTTLSLYYKEEYQFSSLGTGMFLALNGILVLLFELPIVNYVEKNKINRLLVISYGVLAMAISYLMIVIGNNVFLLVLMMIFMTLGVMLTFPFANNFVKERSLKKQEGKFMAVFTMSYSVAQIISTKTGMEIIAAYGYRTNWIALTLLGFFGFFLAYRLINIVNREREEIKEKIIQSFFIKGKN